MTNLSGFRLQVLPLALVDFYLATLKLRAVNKDLVYPLYQLEHETTMVILTLERL